MPDGGDRCTEDTLRDLAEVVIAPAQDLPELLSRLVASFVPHDALILLAADAAGGHRGGAGDEELIAKVSFLQLDELRRNLAPGTVRTGEVVIGGEPVALLQMVARNGALLLVARPRLVGDVDARVVHLWNVVALRVQALADAAAPGYLQLARASSGERMVALSELADEYSTTLESVLAALRSPSLDDRAARETATRLAAEGVVHLRTASDRVRTVTEEPVTSAFARLREDLRPLVRYRDIDVQFIEPPVDGRPLPSEVAHGARAAVRGLVLALVDRPEVRRVRVEWGCDGTNLLVRMRDDGPGDLTESSVQVQLVAQRIHALDGLLNIEAIAGWGTEVSIVIPLDPPHSPGTLALGGFGLRPREVEVLQQIAAGRRNRDIAAALSISENTVKYHVAGIYRKLDVRGRAEATALFLSQSKAAVL